MARGKGEEGRGNWKVTSELTRGRASIAPCHGLR